MPATGSSTSSSRTSVSTRCRPGRRCGRRGRGRGGGPGSGGRAGHGRRRRRRRRRHGCCRGRSVRGPRSFRDRPRSRPPSRLPPSAGVSARRVGRGLVVVATAGPFSPCSGRSARSPPRPRRCRDRRGVGSPSSAAGASAGMGGATSAAAGSVHRAGGGNRLGRGAAGGFGGSARGTSRPGRRTATTRGGAGHRRVRRGGIRAQNVPVHRRSMPGRHGVRAGRRHDRQRRPRSGLARLPLADRRDQGRPCASSRCRGCSARRQAAAGRPAPWCSGCAGGRVRRPSRRWSPERRQWAHVRW